MSPALRRRRLAVVLLLFSGGCRCGKSPGDAPSEDTVQPVYAGAVSSPEPRARRVCDSLHLLPEQRRTACCGGPRPGRMLADECTRILTLALRGGSVALDDARATACGEVQDAALKGCGWIGPGNPPLPESCQALTVGKLEQGARCRSALECRDGLRCRGLGPTQPGVCDVPGPPTTACELGTDPLAVYLRQDTRQHPECSGTCVRRTCIPASRTGEACAFTAQCGPGAHCAGGRCEPGQWAHGGEPCVVGACEAGATCRGGICTPLKQQGQRCGEDVECLGACLRPDGGAVGTCGMRCAI